ncbi:Crp/Fnr family transcriptional regulator [Terrabacter sp. 2RAF25]|uniref:Crp/Fnr family transcriptional regulator n=1 Tax=Terrabacter sp. 2RAF25 TaxID=3232998 RepID=UPI003F94A21E
MTRPIGLLAELSPAERRAVLARMSRHTYAVGDVVCTEGDPADAVHFVVEGRIVARRASADGDVHAYAVMGPGQAFGEIAMIRQERRRTATIEALEPTVTLSLRYADFEQLCAAHPEVNRLLLRLLAARVTRLTDALMQALHEPAEQRVVRVLLSLCGLYGSPAPGEPPITVALNQTVLAELAGVTRPTANRVLRRLESEGVVRLDRARVSIRDPSALAAHIDLPDLTPREIECGEPRGRPRAGSRHARHPGR